jgi:hypothetical protein
MYKKLGEEKFSRRVLPVNMPRSRVRALARASYRALARDNKWFSHPGKAQFKQITKELGLAPEEEVLEKLKTCKTCI